MGAASKRKIDRRAIGCTSIIIALGLVGYIVWNGMDGGQGVIPSGQQAAGREGVNDCFIPKQGDAPCVVDFTDAVVERFPTDDNCQGVRVRAEVDTELVALDLATRGEVVVQVHPQGGSNDGSADTGVGMGHYGSDWQIFRFGPNGAQPPEGASSAEIDGQNVNLELNSFADGSCIEDNSELRVKLQFDDANGNPIYDIFGFGGGLMEYHSIAEYIETFGSQ